MKNKVVYIHIGFHKTGTTAIQSLLYQNREQLHKDGYLYPLTKFHPKGQQALAYAVTDSVFPLTGEKLNKEEVFACLMDLIASDDSPNIVISSENFKAANPEVITTLAELFASFTVKIVVYIRRHDQFFQALYQENVKPPNSITLPISEFKADFDMDYLGRLDAWERVFGKENMIVRLYDNNEFVGGNIFTDFLTAIGVSDCEAYTPPERRINESLDPITTELLRQANINGLVEQHKFVRYLRNHFKPENAKSVGFMTDEERSHVLDQYTEMNAVIAEKYFEREILFQSVSEGGGGTTNEVELNPEELVSLIVKLWNESHGVVNDSSETEVDAITTEPEAGFLSRIIAFLRG